MKTTIVCGLLGAGKTTFIRQFLKNSREKTVVLVNDFGEVGIDGEIYSSSGIESIELPSGCVCCTLKFDLMTTLQKIAATLSPEHLVIEPSGVASPSGVLEALDALKIRPVTVVGIIDATEFIDFYESRMYGTFFEDQIANSDVILVNKADLAGRDQVAGTVGIVEGMNAKAIILPAVNAAIDIPLPVLSGNERTLRKHLPHFDFETASVRLEGTGELSWYQNLFEEMSRGAFGNVVRAKALVRTDEGPFRFDLSCGKIGWNRFGKEIAEGRLVMIGAGLKREGLPSPPQKAPLVFCSASEAENRGKGVQ
ncbi:MAG: GTP-binding protein [Nitrospirae bacterium]|nr:GTP-binding protein [Nitrospirota bacterium]